MTSPYALSPREAADYSGLGLTTIKRLLRGGVIPCRKHGRRTIVLTTDLEAYLLSLPSGRSSMPRGAAGRFAAAPRDAS